MKSVPRRYCVCLLHHQRDGGPLSVQHDCKESDICPNKQGPATIESDLRMNMKQIVALG